jgi:thiamine transport system permease protein
MRWRDSDRTIVRVASAVLERHALALAGLATGAVLLVAFYYPVATVLIEAVPPVPDDQLWIPGVLTDPFYLRTVLGFTVYQAALSTVASVLLGLPAAWILARFEFPGRRTLRSLTILPFVLPSIMVAIGFVATFGRNGTLNGVLAVLGLAPLDLLFTVEAIVVAHAFYNAPLVARLTTAAWESVDARTVETARSLGASRPRAFRDVIAPQLYPSILIGATLTFVFTFASFPIVLALGGSRYPTVEVFIYQLVQRLDYAEAASLATVEMAVSLGLVYAYLRYEARQRATSRGARPLARHSLWPDSLSARSVATRLAIAGYALVAVVLFVGPIASMIVASVTTGDGALTLRHYEFLLQRQVEGAAFQVRPLPAVRNSVLLGGGTLLVALPMGVTVAVLTARRYPGRKVVDALAMAPIAVSGIVVGLGLLRGLVFGVEVGGWRLTASGWLAILAAHAVAAYPFVTRNVAPMLERLDPAMVESARSLGASRSRALVDVELPLVWSGVVAGAAFAFAISVGEFDATVILAQGAGQYTMPVAVERFLGRRLGPATAMGCVLLAVTACSFLVIDRFGSYEGGSL